MSSAAIVIKQGDSLPISGAVRIEADDPCGCCAPGEPHTPEDFSLWSISGQLRTPDGSLVYDMQPAFVDGGPAFQAEVPSAVTEALSPGTEYRFDLRFRDGAGVVTSMPTRSLKVLPAVSELPA